MGITNMKSRKNYYGCAHEIPKTDDRHPKWKEQRKTRGFDDTETWSLDRAIAAFTLPRLKRFREIEVCWPGNLKSRVEWNKILDEMIYYFEWLLKDNNLCVIEERRAIKGWKLFVKYYRALWW